MSVVSIVTFTFSNKIKQDEVLWALTAVERAQQEKYSDEHYLGSLQTAVSILHNNPVSVVHARDGGTSK